MWCALAIASDLGKATYAGRSLVKMTSPTCDTVFSRSYTHNVLAPASTGSAAGQLTPAPNPTPDTPNAAPGPTVVVEQPDGSSRVMRTYRRPDGTVVFIPEN